MSVKPFPMFFVGVANSNVVRAVGSLIDGATLSRP